MVEHEGMIRQRKLSSSIMKIKKQEITSYRNNNPILKQNKESKINVFHTLPSV